MTYSLGHFIIHTHKYKKKYRHPIKYYKKASPYTYPNFLKVTERFNAKNNIFTENSTIAVTQTPKACISQRKSQIHQLHAVYVISTSHINTTQNPEPNQIPQNHRKANPTPIQTSCNEKDSIPKIKT